MKLLKEIHKKENGQALIIVAILMLVGALIITPLLGYMGTGLMVGQVFEEKMDEVYAADAGVEDAIYNIITPAAPYYTDLQNLAENGSYSYSLTGSVNGISPVSITVTKLSLLQGVLGEDEYGTDRPHEDWLTFDAPQMVDQTTDYVEYSCDLNFEYLGGGNRRIQSVGVLLSPFPGDENLIDGLYDIVYTPVMTDANLEAGSPETKIASGGFAFLWRWEKNNGPLFNSGDTGTLSFKFKIWDPNWVASTYYIFATVKEQDISFVTNLPNLYKWLIEATAGDTTVQSAILEEIGVVNILTWEVSP